MLETLLMAKNLVRAENTLALVKASNGFKELANALDVTKNRTPVINTTVTKFDKASFDFANGWINVGASSDFVYTKDGAFTIEWWQCITSWTNNNWFLAKGGGASSGFKTYQGSLYLQTEGASWNAATTSVLALNTWQHIAIVLRSGIMRLYVDGALKGNIVMNNNFGLPSVILQWGGGNGYPATGYLDQLRISKIPRYLNNFSPPTTAFVVD